MKDEGVKETEQRYRQRQGPREETIRRLKEGSVFDANDPERVRLRLKRLGMGLKTEPPALTPLPSAAPDTYRVESVTMLERVIGRNDLIPIRFLETGWAVSRSVARIIIGNSRGLTVGYGTGFMVSPNLLLTNNHVLESAEDAAFSQAEFDFQQSADGTPLPTTVYQLDPEGLFITDARLDFTVVAIREDSGGQPAASFGWNPLIKQQGKALLGELLNIVQHPNGEPKQLALRENELVDLLEDFMHYHTDTSPGSSGSPVYNDQWEVVGLHHSGVPRRDAQGKILSVFGTVWTQDMGEHRIDWIANEGIRISRIVEHLERQDVAGRQEELLDELLAAEGVPAPALGTLARGRSEQLTPTATTQSPRHRVEDDGAVTWTLPVEISVRIGHTEASQAVLQRPQAVTAPARRTPQEDADLRHALTELAEATEKPYFDADADAADRDSYYEDLPESEDPAELFRSLSNLLEETHAPRWSYKPSREVYPWVDLQPNLKLRSAYSNEEFDPADFIVADFHIEQQRERRLQERLSAETSASEEDVRRELVALEAELPFNCEHVVPQSWFDADEPMRGDLHHLFACESRCNSFRANIPYFDFADFMEVVRDECGKREEEGFEPNANKGVVARATLYFLLRYPGVINDSAEEYEREDIELLLGWHEDNPVSLYEQHRNATIRQRQGNRNPLIDFPDRARQIDFILGLGLG